MPASTLTSKGQITLPRDIRRVLRLQPGDRVSFRVREDGTVVVEPETVDLRELRGSVRPRRRGVTAEEMREAVRRRGARKG